jgi:hypothetical protein
MTDDDLDDLHDNDPTPLEPPEIAYASENAWAEGDVPIIVEEINADPFVDLGGEGG